MGAILGTILGTVLAPFLDFGILDFQNPGTHLNGNLEEASRKPFWDHFGSILGQFLAAILISKTQGTHLNGNMVEASRRTPP